MSNSELVEIANAMVVPGKGILAMDESNGTCKKRFDPLGVAFSEENRRQYREMLITTENLSDYISGAILYDETLRQRTSDGRLFVDVMNDAGILPGIKVDAGAHALAGFPTEKVTEGLDGLRDRLKEYKKLGAKFAKWRAVITINDEAPSSACIEANVHALARYAALCQEQGIVPIVEPEVLMDGDHDIEICDDVCEAAHRSLFSALYEHNVLLEGIILKPSMVLPGKDCPQQADVQQVAEHTLRCLLNSVPASVAGVVFLSGGQSNELATAHLDAMNKLQELPWPLTFSYGRALQNPALRCWAKNLSSNVKAAQEKLLTRARLNGLASLGDYAGE